MGNIIITIDKICKTISGTINSGMDIKGSFDSAHSYYNSSQRKADLAKANKIYKKERIFMKFSIILWIAIIVSTIYLCVTGNDIVLKLLHI